MDSETLSPSDLAELRSQLRVLDAKLSRLLPAEPDAVADAMSGLDRAICRLRAGGSQLLRTVQRRIEVETDPAAARERKGRLPRVCKSLTAPGEAADLLRRAAAARGAGPQTYQRFLERARVELAAV